MKSIRFLGGVLSVPDVVCAEICVLGRWWAFDYDRQFGPLWLKRNGEPRKCQNPSRAVWSEFERWRAIYEASGFSAGILKKVKNEGIFRKNNSSAGT